jgi:ferredoxin
LLRKSNGRGPAKPKCDRREKLKAKEDANVPGCGNFTFITLRFTLIKEPIVIITKQKDLKEILKYLDRQAKVFIIGCGECSATCKTGGEEEIKKVAGLLEKEGKSVTGYCIPSAPCISAKVKMELAKNRKAIESSDAVLVMACGLGIQSVKENMRIERPVRVGCDTLFMGTIDSSGVFLERCSACGDCVLELTGLICPITRCPKSLLNGPCGGQDKGKCEVDKTRDCAWVLIYKELKKQGKLSLLKEMRPPKDNSKSTKPRQHIAG